MKADKAEWKKSSNLVRIFIVLKGYPGTVKELYALFVVRGKLLSVVKKKEVCDLNFKNSKKGKSFLKKLKY